MLVPLKKFALKNTLETRTDLSIELKFALSDGGVRVLKVRK